MTTTLHLSSRLRIVLGGNSGRLVLVSLVLPCEDGLHQELDEDGERSRFFELPINDDPYRRQVAFLLQILFCRQADMEARLVAAAQMLVEQLGPQRCPACRRARP